uniref:Uncharacterized protein n=1 Tax=Gasterosteus aculeatus TaxID=69293 RepID=G3NUU0_GASAC
DLVFFDGASEEPEGTVREGNTVKREIKLPPLTRCPAANVSRQIFPPCASIDGSESLPQASFGVSRSRRRRQQLELAGSRQITDSFARATRRVHNACGAPV